jgi:thiamine biosynthesis lipoprotein
MRQIRLLMGMPITIEVVDPFVTADTFDRAFDYFQYVDETFSPFKDTSEVTRISRGELHPDQASRNMQLILQLSEQTRLETDGYFDVWHNGNFDPCGIVKGWSIHKASKRLEREGYRNFYVDAGGDIQISGTNAEGQPWRVGVRNPFEADKIVKALALTHCGIATSGPYIRGDHIYNPRDEADQLNQIVSMTVVGRNVYEADRFATAAFAMGEAGMLFIDSQPGLEGYMIDRTGRATFTRGFAEYCLS